MSDFTGTSPSDKVFEERRRQRPTARDIMMPSAIAYYAVIVLCIFTGYGVMSATAVLLDGWLPTEILPIIALIVGVFVAMILGAVIVLHTGWLPSFLAYHGLVAAPFGALFGPFVIEVGRDNLVAAIVLVAAATVVLGLIGLAIRADLSKTGFAKVITVLLWIFVIVSFITIKAQITSVPVYITIASIGVALFGCLIVLDFNRAKHLPHTLDNAVDSSMLIFLDSLNMLIRVAGILSKLRK